MNDHPGAFRRPLPTWADQDGEPLRFVHPEVLASDQCLEAIQDLERPANTYVRWPFPELDALTGPMAPGNVWFICAASGGGKTTFVASIIDLWQLAGTKVYVMPLETRPSEFRTYLACMATGVHPGDALSGQLASMADGGGKRELLKTEFFAQMRAPYVNHVLVSGQSAINLAGLEEGMHEARDFGADVVIVDHIDHIEDDNDNLYTAAKKVNDGALRLAQANKMLVVFTSQLNMSASKGDYLSKFLPPKDEHIAFGSLKRRNATGMIGLFRPVRGMRPGETEDDYLKTFKAARSGSGDVMDALEPNTMGVVAMKLRNYGAREGAKAMLAVRHGRVFPMEERDKWSTAGTYPRKVV